MSVILWRLRAEIILFRIFPTWIPFWWKDNRIDDIWNLPRTFILVRWLNNWIRDRLIEYYTWKVTPR